MEVQPLFLSEYNKIYNCILSGRVEKRRNKPAQKILIENIETANKIINCEPPIIGKFDNLQFNNIAHYKVVEYIEKIIIKTKPDYIFTHHPSDLNNDHYQTSIACQAAFRLFQRRQSVKMIKRIILHGDIIFDRLVF